MKWRTLYKNNSWEYWILNTYFENVRFNSDTSIIEN